MPGTRASCPRSPTTTQPFSASQRILRRTVSRDSGGADRHRVAGTHLAQMLARIDEAVEALVRVSRDLVVEPLDVVVADRPKHDGRGQVAVECRVHPDQVLRQEPTRQVGQLTAIGLHEFPVQHDEIPVPTAQNGHLRRGACPCTSAPSNQRPGVRTCRHWEPPVRESPSLDGPATS
jgi:hypothetical protein